ncbi:MAG: type II toxin-antitoxin system HicA family toxin [Chloroflexi bacterium]|nr:type II toxin-antitoxin system HicA family toxin [Chloroflexota bacterium]
MPKYTQLPIITGKKLVKLLEKDGWVVHRRTRHGVALIKVISERTKVTIIPDSSARLDDGTLSAILGPKQTGIGKRGLLEIVNKWGI